MRKGEQSNQKKSKTEGPTSVKPNLRAPITSKINSPRAPSHPQTASPAPEPRLLVKAQSQWQSPFLNLLGRGEAEGSIRFFLLSECLAGRFLAQICFIYVVLFAFLEGFEGFPHNMIHVSLAGFESASVYLFLKCFVLFRGEHVF